MSMERHSGRSCKISSRLFIVMLHSSSGGVFKDMIHATSWDHQVLWARVARPLITVLSGLIRNIQKRWSAWLGCVDIYHEFQRNCVILWAMANRLVLSDDEWSFIFLIMVSRQSVYVDHNGHFVVSWPRMGGCSESYRQNSTWDSILNRFSR